MKITVALKSYLLAQGWAEADQDDDELQTIVMEKLTEGELTPGKLAELSTETQTSAQKALSDMIRQQVQEALAPVTKAIKEKFSEPDESDDDEDDDGPQTKKMDLGAALGNGPNPRDVLSQAAERASSNVRVKEPVEWYENTRKAIIFPQFTAKGLQHPLAGQPASYGDFALETPSQRDKAVIQAYFKTMLALSPFANDVSPCLRPTDHDKALFQWSLRNSLWTGPLGGSGPNREENATWINHRRLTDYEMKVALLDDSASGGLEIVPIEFDSAMIMPAILEGELFPRVKIVNIARGRRIEGASIGQPTVTWNIAEGAAIPPFDAAAFVSAFDTSIFDVKASMEIGLDFLDDSPTTIGSEIPKLFGSVFRNDLDRVVAIGDGTNEPQGVFSSGALVVASDNGGSGPPTVADYEALYFGIDKAYRESKGGKLCYIANDTSYGRSRSMAVGSNDQRRILGLDYGSYKFANVDYAIQNGIPNTKIGLFNLDWYRMYKRLGMTIKTEMGGNYLSQRNLKLIIVRGRFGGRMEKSNAGAICTTAMA